MIDYIKIRVENCDAQSLLKNPNLNFKRMVSETTGEISSKTTCYYRHCKILVFDSGTVLFQGSLHKLFNTYQHLNLPTNNSLFENGFNGNDFNYHDIEFAKQRLAELFKVNLTDLIIQNIEFGINLEIPFPPKLFINGLLMYQNKPFEYKYEGYFASCIHNQYNIKIYDKGKQYKQNKQLLRVEVKVKRMQYQKNEIGLNTLYDINPTTLNKILNFIRRRIEGVLYFDYTINESKLNKREKGNIQRLANPKYWLLLKPNKRDTKRKQLQHFTRLHSDQLKLKILNCLKNYRVIFYKNIVPKKKVKFDPLNIPASNIVHCPVTGLQFEPLDSSNYLLSQLHLRKLKINDYDSFLLIKDSYLTSKHLLKDERTQIKEIAHNIRDTIRNKKVSYKSRNPEHQLKLFPFP